MSHKAETLLRPTLRKGPLRKPRSPGVQIFVEVPGKSSTSGASWTLASGCRRRLGGGGGFGTPPVPHGFSFWCFLCCLDLEVILGVYKAFCGAPARRGIEMFVEVRVES